MGISDDARTVAPRPGRLAAKRLHRGKVLAAFAVTAVVGIGSYAATYRALEMISVTTPATNSGSVTPVSSHPATVPSTASPDLPPH
jgi:hypothetical protein